jgi:hypothetical protein
MRQPDAIQFKLPFGEPSVHGEIPKAIHTMQR